MLRVFDAYCLFYYAFLSDEKVSYRDILNKTIERYNISSNDMEVIKKIWDDLKVAQKTLALEDRKRKDRIIDKIIYKEKIIYETSIELLCCRVTPFEGGRVAFPKQTSSNPPLA